MRWLECVLWSSAALALSFGCGGSSDDANFGGSANDGGPDAGGAAGSAGSSGSSGSSGASGSSGSSGSSGDAGSSGSSGASGSSGSSGSDGGGGCTNSLDCQGNTVCDPATHECVECVTSADCSDTGHCAANHCRPGCVSDVTCTPLGLLCDKLNGYCVECLVEGDCDPNHHCSAGVCEPDLVCTPSSIFCEPGSERLIECAADGLSQTVTEDCASSDEVCVADACAAVVCDAGQRFCQGNQVRQCSPKGDSSTLASTCTAVQFCDPSTAACKTQLCAPSQKVCDGSIATTCKADGSGYAPGGTDCAPDACEAGDCVTVLFKEDFEDGDYAGWTTGTGSYTRAVTTSSAADGTTTSFSQYKSSADGYYDGIHHTFSALKPSSISWWARVTQTVGYAAQFALFPSTGSSNALVHVAFAGGGVIYLGTGSGAVSTPYTSGTWYHFEIRNIDWTARTFDFYKNGALVRAGYAFEGTGTSISRLDLFNYDSATYGYWDEIEFR